MGGFFGVVSKQRCVEDIFYGTDYHSHLGTKRGGMAVLGKDGVRRSIHSLESSYFRTKFEADLPKLDGNSGIGVISDCDSQPLIIGSHLGTFAIVTVGKINNIDELVTSANNQKGFFSESTGGVANPTEVVAMLICQGGSFEEGIQKAQALIKGSCSMLLLTDEGIFAARDKLGRTPICIAEKDGALAAASESCSFPNLGYEVIRFLGPGEIGLITPEGYEQKIAAGDKMQVCSFLWVYYGYPATEYEGINTEDVRNRCGAALAKNDTVTVDYVGGIPDSGIGHAIGYANARCLPYRRPFVKYTPTWPRSFMPQNQNVRDLVAKMKLIPIKKLITGQRMLFCEDSIVRGTQLQDIIRRIFDYGAKEVHMRPACPPLIFGCKFLNFSQSRSEMDLAGRRAIHELEGGEPEDLTKYADPDSESYRAMVEGIRVRLGLTSLQYQRLDDLIAAIGLPREKLCTYCWDGTEQ